MKILWVATKAPWPPVDGGRLLLLNTLRALADAGHELTLVAPVDTEAEASRAEPELRPYCRPSLVVARHRPMWLDAARAQLTRKPLTIVRHTLPAVRRRVAELLRDDTFDLAQAEQVQALSAMEPAFQSRVPVVLRAQNVESELWRQSSRAGGWRRQILALEARRLAAWEGRAVRRCAATLALTTEDVERLAELSGAQAKVRKVAAPFEPELPSAAEPLTGSPAVVLFGSGGWRPNAEGASWFLSQVWPAMHAAVPSSKLHVFGLDAAGEGVVNHPAPAESRAAYPEGGVLMVPLEVASGVRIKILEAWSRGLPVIATPAAASGLDAQDGEHLLQARDANQMSSALRRVTDPEVRSRLIAGGRRQLRERHSFERIATRLSELYERLEDRNVSSR